MTMVYAVTSYSLDDTGASIEGIFSSEREAERWIENASIQGDDRFEIEAVPLDRAPVRSTYWHRGAHVLPDGRIEDWKEAHTSYHDPMMPVDDHLEPWNGHTQGHCGWHISIFGSDEAALEIVFQRQVQSILPLCDGTCVFCGRTADYKLEFWDGKGL